MKRLEAERTAECNVPLNTCLPVSHLWPPKGFIHRNSVIFNYVTYRIGKLHYEVSKNPLKCIKAFCYFHTVTLPALICKTATEFQMARYCHTSWLCCIKTVLPCLQIGRIKVDHSARTPRIFCMNAWFLKLNTALQYCGTSV